MNLTRWCDRVIRTGFVLLFALVPLLLTPWNYELFEYNKMMAVYGLTVTIVGAWIIKMVNDKEIRIAKTPLDIPIALFFLSQLVSTLFSIDHHVSWFGYYSRFNGGMLSVISYLLLYYALASNLTHWSNWPKLLKAMLTTGAVVALYGVLERMGIDKHLWVQDVQNRVFSSLGQPNWLAAYLVVLIPLAFGFSLKKFYWIGLSVLFFTVILFTRSRSGLVGFAAADIAFWGLILARRRLAKRRLAKQGDALKIPFVICHLSFVILVFLFGTSIDSIDRWIRPAPAAAPATEATPSAYTAPLLEYGGTESGTIRKYVWQGAVAAWQSSVKTVLIGTGTETFAFAFYQYRPREHNLTSEWDFLYNKAHNEYLNYLTTTGAFGLGSYLLLIGSALWWFIKNRRSQDTLNFALFAGWSSILVTNFFGFSVVTQQLFFFLIPAMLVPVSAYRIRELHLAGGVKWFVLGISLLTVVILGRLWWGDFLFAEGYRNARLRQYVLAQQALEAAISVNPIEPLYHDEAASTLSLLASVAIENQDATAAANFARESIRQSDEALKISPNNVNYWKTRTKILYAFAPFDETFIKAAVTSLEKAGTLSPNDAKILYNLAVLYGQEGNNTKAIELLKAAIDIKPNYRDAYWALQIFYNEIGQPELAKSAITEYLTKVDPNDADFKQALTQ